VLTYIGTCFACKDLQNHLTKPPDRWVEASLTGTDLGRPLPELCLVRAAYQATSVEGYIGRGYIVRGLYLFGLKG